MILSELLLTWQLYTRQIEWPPPAMPEPREVEVIEEPVEEPVLGQGFRQTFYSVVGNNETHLGYLGLSENSPKIRNINNIMHYNDEEFGWLPVIAVDINAVKDTGLNENWTYNAYGSVLEVDYEDGTCTNAIVLDACGACAVYDRIDLWVYRDDYAHDKSVEAIEIIRRGFEEDSNEQNDTETNQNEN